MDASGHCYSIIRVNQATAGLSWFSAESQCEAWGGTLASIGNAQVSTLLATIIQPLQADITSKQITGFWFGLSKDRWVWRVDGTCTDLTHMAITYNNWGNFAGKCLRYINYLVWFSQWQISGCALAS
jgi:hypothetical protein